MMSVKIIYRQVQDSRKFIPTRLSTVYGEPDTIFLSRKLMKEKSKKTKDTVQTATDIQPTENFKG